MGTAGYHTVMTCQETESAGLRTAGQRTSLQQSKPADTVNGDDKNISYTYDPAGNLTEEHSTEHKKIYSYDTYNRNTEINGNDFTQKNHYDAEGYRYSIEENDKVTNFVYRRGIMLAELDEAGNQAKTYTLGNEYAGHVSELNNSLTSENKAASYYITDEQGSIRYILD